MPDITMNPPIDEESARKGFMPEQDLYEKRQPERRDMTVPTSCKACQHMLVCKAFEMVNQVQNQFNQEVEFVKFPFPPESLATNCKEYMPIQNREDIGSP